MDDSFIFFQPLSRNGLVANSDTKVAGSNTFTVESFYLNFSLARPLSYVNSPKNFEYIGLTNPSSNLSIRSKAHSIKR